MATEFVTLANLGEDDVTLGYGGCSLSTLTNSLENQVPGAWPLEKE